MVHFQEIESSVETLSKFNFLKKLELDQTMLENVQQINLLGSLNLSELSISEKDNPIWNCGIFPEYLIYRLRDLKVFNSKMISVEERNNALAQFHSFSILASLVPMTQLLQKELLCVPQSKERLSLPSLKRHSFPRDAYDSDDDDGYGKSCSHVSCSKAGTFPLIEI
jgi:hypothetical protein